jgi:hypothetical protein
VDDVNVVVRPLLDHWENTHQLKRQSSLPSDSVVHENKPTYDGLPIGLEIRAVFHRREFHARIESGGIRLMENKNLYNSLSRAAIELKREFFGLNEASASTNGWKFWMWKNPDSGQWKEVDVFRRSR